MEIPITSIQYGVLESLNSSLRIISIAKTLPSTEHDIKYAVILFYYALEEYGKALLLEGENDNITQNQTHINPTWFYCHNHKIRSVRIRHPNLYIPKYKFPQIEGKADTLTNEGDVAETFQDRSNLLLTDYDDKTNRWGWGKNLEHIEDEDVMKKLDELEQLVRPHQKQCKEKIKETK